MNFSRSLLRMQLTNAVTHLHRTEDAEGPRSDEYARALAAVKDAAERLYPRSVLDSEPTNFETVVKRAAVLQATGLTQREAMYAAVKEVRGDE